jgi:hypothetical protein
MRELFRRFLFCVVLAAAFSVAAFFAFRAVAGFTGAFLGLAVSARLTAFLIATAVLIRKCQRSRIAQGT